MSPHLSEGRFTSATIGLLGAFTTFSAYSWEAAALLRDGATWGASGRVAASLLARPVGVVAGLGPATRILQPGG